MEQKKARTYLLYALGEIALVVIGILIALQVNNWNEDTTRRAQEKVYLQLIKDDLLLQKQENENQRSGMRNTTRFTAELTEHIRNRFQVTESQREVVKMQLNTLILGRTYGSYEATFLDLTSSGNIALLTNQELKNSIIQHYQVQKRDRDVINNNTNNTYLQMWSKLADRDLILLPLELDVFGEDGVIMNFDPSLSFLDEELFENLASEDNLILMQNVLAYKVIATNIATRFIDESDRRIDVLIEAIELEMRRL